MCLLKYSKTHNVQTIGRLLDPLCCEGWLSFYGSRGCINSYNKSSTHNSWGYLVHGPYCYPCTCWNIRNYTKFMRSTEYLTHSVAMADCHFIKAYGLYYSYIQFCTHSSKCYLIHGPYFYTCECWNMRKYNKFLRMADYLTHCHSRQKAIVILCNPWVCLFVHTVLDPKLQGLFGKWTILLSMCVLKYANMH